MDQVLRSERREQLGLAAEVCDGLVERVLAIVEPGENCAAADGETALVELVAQLCGVLRHEALRTELCIYVARTCDLVEVDVPGHLVRVAREPDAP